MKRIAYDWAVSQHNQINQAEITQMSEIQNPITKYKLLLLLDANRINPNTDLVTAVKEQLFIPCHTAEVLAEFIREYPEDVAVILDGIVREPTRILWDIVLNDCLIVATTRSEYLPLEDFDDFISVTLTR